MRPPLRALFQVHPPQKLDEARVVAQRFQEGVPDNPLRTVRRVEYGTLEVAKRALPIPEEHAKLGVRIG